MKHWWKVLTIGLVFGLSATLFAACGPEISASTKTENPTEPTWRQTEDVTQFTNVKVPDEQSNNQPSEASNEQPSQKVNEDNETPAEDDELQSLHKHSFGDLELVRASTCVEHGLEIRRCACGATEEHELPLSDEHQYHNHIIVKKVEPTCTEDGYTVYRCDNCDATYREEGEEAYGHQKEIRINKNPTCTTAGESIEYCTRCQKVIETHAIEPTGIHHYDEHTHQCACGAQQPPLENLQNSYWYDSEQNCRILFQTFEPDGKNQFKGKYTTEKLKNDKFFSTADNYSGEYTVYINTTIIIHLDNQVNTKYNPIGYNDLTYSSEGSNYQLSGILFNANKNYTLIFVGYGVQ